jgi:hypothetical protein
VIKGDLTVCGEITSKKIPVPPSGSQSISIPDGPYAVDAFQLGVDNAQFRSPVKYKVSDVTNPIIPASEAKTVTVDGVEYYGETVDNAPVYLTYPTPVNFTVFVPSTRECKTEPFDFFPDEDEDNQFAGLLSLDTIVAAAATSFNTDGYGNLTSPPTIPSTTIQSILSEVIPNSFALDIKNQNPALWVGLTGKRLLDQPLVDVYTRFLAVQASLASITQTTANAAVLFMLKVMGSLGVSCATGGINSINQVDRERVLNLIRNSNNYKQYKRFKAYSPVSPPQQSKVNDVFGTQYKLGGNIQTSFGKIPIVFNGDPNTVLTSRAVGEKVASWGVAFAICSHTYDLQNNRVPGRLTSAEDIICRGTCFPDYVRYLTTSGSGYGNYNYLGDSDVSTNQFGSAGTWPFTFGYLQSTTGTTSFEYCADAFASILDIFASATDGNGEPLKDYLDLKSVGSYGRSAGVIMTVGANEYARNNLNIVKAIFSDDTGYIFPYNAPEPYYSGSADFVGSIDDNVTFAYPTGFHAPIVTMEVSVDHFAHYWDKFYTFPADFPYYGGSRGTVGTRKELQNIYRRTNLVTRTKCIYLEHSATAHSSSNGVRGISADSISESINLLIGIRQPDLPSVPASFDPVFGFNDMFDDTTRSTSASMRYALRNLFTLFFRMHLSKQEWISSGMMKLSPFNMIFGPWDIPGADDYQWRSRKWEMDLGGKYTMELNDDNSLVISDDTDTGAKLLVKPTTLNVANLPTSAVGLVSGDLWIDTVNAVIKVVP